MTRRIRSAACCASRASCASPNPLTAPPDWRSATGSTLGCSTGSGYASTCRGRRWAGSARRTRAASVGPPAPRGPLRPPGAGALLLGVVASVAVAAIQQARSTRRFLYPADMNVVQQALEEGKPARARQLLEAYVPVPHRFWQEDLRGFEWHYL